MRALPIRSHRTQPTKDTARWRFGNNTINILPFCGTAVNLVVAHRPVAGGRARAEFSRQTPLHSSRAASCRVPPPAARRKGQSRGGEREGEGAKMEERERERAASNAKVASVSQSVQSNEGGREAGRSRSARLPLALRRREDKGEGEDAASIVPPSFLQQVDPSIHPILRKTESQSSVQSMSGGGRTESEKCTLPILQDISGPHCIRLSCLGRAS